MSFVRSLGLAVLLVTATACNGNSSSTPSTGPNPTSTTITVTTSKGAPIAELQVILSTGLTNGVPTGVITSAPTSSAGQVTFSNLPHSGQLCASTSNVVGVTIYRANHCAAPFPGAYTLKFSSKMPGS
jgi:hypothetical protein